MQPADLLAMQRRYFVELRGQVAKGIEGGKAVAEIIKAVDMPWYKEWTDRFKDKNVVLIGIHTPETKSERETASVRSKAADEKFAFPILIDGNGENWNAWGNSMWPAVYVIDKRGYLREFWPGELKWQGNDGEKFIRERIERLLASPATP